MEASKAPTAAQNIFGNSELSLSTAALLSGAWAFAQPLNSTADRIPLLASLTLVLGGWYSFWAAITRTNWAKALVLWRDWEQEAPLPRWPYLQPGTPGAHLHRTLGQVRAWWHDIGYPSLNTPLRRAARALLVSLLISTITGRIALLLTLFFIAWTEIAVLWHEGTGQVHAIWRAAALVGLPWLLGTALHTPPTGQAAMTALVLTLLIGLFSSPSSLSITGPLIAAMFLIGQSRALAAGWLLILALPGFLFLRHRFTINAYHHAVTPWLLGMLLLVAGSMR